MGHVLHAGLTGAPPPPPLPPPRPPIHQRPTAADWCDDACQGGVCPRIRPTPMTAKASPLCATAAPRRPPPPHLRGWARHAPHPHPARRPLQPPDGGCLCWGLVNGAASRARRAIRGYIRSRRARPHWLGGGRHVGPWRTRCGDARARVRWREGEVRAGGLRRRRLGRRRRQGVGPSSAVVPHECWWCGRGVPATRAVGSPSRRTHQYPDPHRPTPCT